MSQAAQALEHASVRQYCKAVKVPVIAANFVPLAEQAVKENRGHIGYLEALLAMESEERDRHAIVHRLHDAKLQLRSGLARTKSSIAMRCRMSSISCSRRLRMFSRPILR